MITFRLLSTMAALMGAGGVIAAAVAAHGGAHGSEMAAAAQILLVHAVAVLAAGWWARATPILLPALALLELSALLFAADMAARTLLDHALFPYAAPIGGTALIVAWLWLAGGLAFAGDPQHRT